VHHAGNSSGIVDGAARVLIGTRRPAKRGLKPRARIRAFANIGSEPAIMLTGPVDVTEKVLKQAGMTLDDIDLSRSTRLRLGGAALHAGARHRPRKVNVNGGAIAMGHPLGATGAMILGTVLDELERAQVDRAGDALHRRRHGHRDDHRAASR
jgi:acetyl-CoA C-acetyltransferase